MNKSQRASVDCTGNWHRSEFFYRIAPCSNDVAVIDRIQPRSRLRMTLSRVSLI